MFPELHLTADRRAFSLTFSNTQRDAIHRLSPMPTADSAGVTGLEVAAGHGCLVMRRANVPAAGSQILPYLTRTVCGYGVCGAAWQIEWQTGLAGACPMSVGAGLCSYSGWSGLLPGVTEPAGYSS
jgi:hypothetical protein